MSAPSRRGGGDRSRGGNRRPAPDSSGGRSAPTGPPPSEQAAAVRAVAQPVAEAAGLFLEDVTVTPAGRRRVLRITVDLPETETGGVPMEAVAAVSHAISEALDQAEPMGASEYVLEVSSPGADRPLQQRRHWLRSRGRLVRLTPADGVPTATGAWAGEGPTGRLTAVDDEGVELDGSDPSTARRFGWAEIRGGRVELDFSRPLDEIDVDDDEHDDTDHEDDDELQVDGDAHLEED